MDIAAFVVSLVAVAASGISVWYTRLVTRRAAHADWRARTPVLIVERGMASFPGEPSASYTIVNDGLQHLDNVAIYVGTETSAVAAVGSDWAAAADLGPVRIGESVSFEVAVDVTWPLRFRPIKTRAGQDDWDQALLLEQPYNAHPI